MSRIIQVVVIGNNFANPSDKELAYETGKIIGESGVLLITGGKQGVMKHSSRGARDGGGLVLSILPDSDFEGANDYSDFVIPTGIGYARNLVNVLAGDLVVAIGGGAGTLSELAYAWQFGKPIFAFTSSGWSQRLAEQKRLDDKPKKPIIPIESMDDFERQYFDWLNGRIKKGYTTINMKVHKSAQS